LPNRSTGIVVCRARVAICRAPVGTLTMFGGDAIRTICILAGEGGWTAMSMPKCSRPATVFVAGVFLAIGVGWFTPSAGAADQAKADEQAPARGAQIRGPVASLNNLEFNGSNAPKDPKDRAAIEKLQKMSEHAAPAIAKMLA